MRRASLPAIVIVGACSLAACNAAPPMPVGGGEEGEPGCYPNCSGAPTLGYQDLCTNQPEMACQQPPPAPTGPSSPSTTTAHTYAISTLYLGDTYRSGMTSTGAWQSFGYDLDGKVTGAASIDACTLTPGSGNQVQVDGAGGVDNAWGSQVLPLLEMTYGPLGLRTNQLIQAGHWTQMTYVVGFDDSPGNTTSALGLTGATLAGANDPTIASPWGLGTQWPVAPGSIAGCSSTAGCPAGTNPIASAAVKLPLAYQRGGVFVSGLLPSLDLPVPLPSGSLVLNLRDVLITFQPHTPGSVTQGVIAGVIATSDLVAAVQQTELGVMPTLCSSTALQTIATQIEQTSDIEWNGSTVANDPGITCNAISIGLGFDATEIATPTVIAPGAPAAPSVCGDGG